MVHHIVKQFPGSYNKMGIFPTVARINHSCKPNAHHFYNPDTGEEEVGCPLLWYGHLDLHVYQVWVVEAIPAGCEICISYIRTFCRFVTGLKFCHPFHLI